jgi:hypothetical protein
MKRVPFSVEVISNTLEPHYRWLGAAILILLSLSFVAPANAQSSSFSGRYDGEWLARATVLTTSERVHEGTWDISIASDSKVTGVEFDKTSGEKANMSGFIDEDGYINVTVRYSSGIVTIKGVLEKKGTRLVGTLKQTCVSTGSSCATIEIVLNRASLDRPTQMPDSMRQGSKTDYLECLPKQGTLIVKMKDGSKKIIDLSEAETVTIVP